MAKVLLIEDEEFVRYALAKVLRRAGHDVIEATNGADGIVEVALPDVDIVVTDVVMPDKEGIAVLIDSKHARPDLPVIVISGGGRIAGREYLNTARQLGADAVFAKPLDDRELIDAIDRLVPGRGGSEG